MKPNSPKASIGWHNRVGSVVRQGDGKVMTNFQFLQEMLTFFHDSQIMVCLSDAGKEESEN